MLMEEFPPQRKIHVTLFRWKRTTGEWEYEVLPYWKAAPFIKNLKNHNRECEVVKEVEFYP